MMHLAISAACTMVPAITDIAEEEFRIDQLATKGNLNKNENGKRINPSADLTTERSVKQKIGETEPAGTSDEYLENITNLAKKVLGPRYTSKKRERDKNNSKYPKCSKSNNMDETKICDDTNKNEDSLLNNKDSNIAMTNTVIEFDSTQNSNEQKIASIPKDCDKMLYEAMQNECEEIDYCVDAQNDNEEFIRCLTENNKLDENVSTESCIIEDSFLDDIENEQNNFDEMFVSHDVNMSLYGHGPDELQESVIFGQDSLEPISYSLPNKLTTTAIKQSPIEIPALVMVTTPRENIVSKTSSAQMRQKQMDQTELPLIQLKISKMPIQPEQIPHTQKLHSQVTVAQMPPLQIPKMALSQMPQTHKTLSQLSHITLTQMPHTQATLTQMAQIDLPLPALVPVQKDRTKLIVPPFAVPKPNTIVSLENCHLDVSSVKTQNMASTLHASGNVKCPFCKDEFKSKSLLWIHLLTHQKQPTCLTCGATVELLKAIKPIQEEGQPIQCLECDKSFQSPGHLQQHMVVHNGLPKSDKLRRSVHMRMYRRMRPLMCWDCANGFRQLSAEAALAEWGRIVSCPQCSYVFPSGMKSSRVSQHIAQHLDNIPDEII